MYGMKHPKILHLKLHYCCGDHYLLRSLATRMALSEDSIPWEVNLLKNYCSSRADLDNLSYAKRSVLAASWFIASQSPSTHPDVCLCGEDRAEECVVRQWVEYYLVRIKTETQWDALSKEHLRTVLEELNSHLSQKIFMVGYKLCLADIILYYGLHKYLAGMTFIQKANFTHVCRWFDQVQHFPGVRPFSLPLVVFHKNPDMLINRHSSI